MSRLMSALGVERTSQCKALMARSRSQQNICRTALIV